MSNLQQQEDEDRTDDVRGAMKAAADKAGRDRSQTLELQKIGKLALECCDKGVDQVANLRKLSGVMLKDDTNLTQLEMAIRDAGMAVINSHVEKSGPNGEYLSEKERAEDQLIIPHLRNGFSIGRDENALRRLRAAIKAANG